MLDEVCTSRFSEEIVDVFLFILGGDITSIRLQRVKKSLDRDLLNRRKHADDGIVERKLSEAEADRS